MNNQKGIAPIIVILVLVAIISGGILTWQYFGVPREEIVVPEGEVKEEIENETSNLEIYQNEEFGFEIKHLKDSIVVNVDKIETLYEYAEYEKNIFHVINIQDGNDSYTRVGVYVDNDEKNISICLKTLMEDQDLTEIKEINGVNFYIYKNYQSDDAMGGFRGRVSEYHAIHNDRCYRIESVVHWTDISFIRGASAAKDGTTGEQATEEEIKEQESQIAEKKAIIDDIVSTFRFLE